MLERVGAISIILGTVLGMISSCWLIIRLFRTRFGKLPTRKLRAPAFFLLLSLLMTSLPIAINAILSRFQSLGPHSAIVEGERHITLTGWDQRDYSILQTQEDTIVLQMANADVTDETLKYLLPMKRLRELDLNNSQVTDAGLATIAALPGLKDLRLAQTKITDEGFRQFLIDKDSLANLDLRGTSVASKTVREWKAAQPERRVLK